MSRAGFPLQFTNNATSTLASSITNSATSLALTAGGGSKFPALSGGETFVGTLTKAGSPNTQEIVLVGARSGDTCSSLTRAYDNTSALSWNAGDQFSLDPVASVLRNFAQFFDIEVQAPNYALDTGTAGAIVCAFEAVATCGRQVGMPLRFYAAHTNGYGYVTINDGEGVVALTTIQGTGLAPGMIQAGAWYEITWNPIGFYQLIGNSYYQTNVSLATTGTNPSVNIGAQFTVTNNLCTMSLSPANNAGSNSTSFTLVGIPNALQPNTLQNFPTICYDNGNLVPAMVQVQNSNTLIFFKGVISGGNIEYLANGFTASGLKGCPNLSITYALY